MKFQDKISSGLFVSGIGTDIGKTIVSAIIAKKYNLNYWKPIQCGNIKNTDSMFLSKHVIGASVFPEGYCLKHPLSPLAASQRENIHLDIEKLSLPKSDRPILVEGAGGLLVPITQEFLVIDLIAKLDLPCVLVSQNYLGSINHTLLSIEALKARSIPILGLIFSGEENSETEAIIEKISAVNVLANIPKLDVINSVVLEQVGESYLKRMDEYF
jgi:dethiobiotin synthetase